MYFQRTSMHIPSMCGFIFFFIDVWGRGYKNARSKRIKILQKELVVTEPFVRGASRLTNLGIQRWKASASEFYTVDLVGESSQYH